MGTDILGKIAGTLYIGDEQHRDLAMQQAAKVRPNETFMKPRAALPKKPAAIPTSRPTTPPKKRVIPASMRRLYGTAPVHAGQKQTLYTGFNKTSAEMRGLNKVAQGMGYPTTAEEAERALLGRKQMFAWLARAIQGGGKAVTGVADLAGKALDNIPSLVAQRVATGVDNRPSRLVSKGVGYIDNALDRFAGFANDHYKESAGLKGLNMGDKGYDEVLLHDAIGNFAEDMGNAATYYLPMSWVGKANTAIRGSAAAKPMLRRAMNYASSAFVPVMTANSAMRQASEYSDKSTISAAKERGAGYTSDKGGNRIFSLDRDRFGHLSDAQVKGLDDIARRNQGAMRMAYPTADDGIVTQVR